MTRKKVLKALTPVCFSFLVLSGFIASSSQPCNADSIRSEKIWSELYVLPENVSIDYPIILSDYQWKKLLTPRQYRILRKGGTEKPYSGIYDNLYGEGIYYSAATGQPVFSSGAKFDSGTGWPSFYQPINPGAVMLVEDSGWIMKRVEVLDGSSGSHLGHVFNDGPEPTGLRYCINTEALIFVPRDAQPPDIVREYIEQYGK
jgi:methionine-R-sulfoxide reductase